MARNLPTGEEYLDSLFVAPDNHDNPTEDLEFLNEATELMRRGDFPDDADIEQYVKDAFDPVKAFRGAAAKAIRDYAQTFLSAHQEYLRAIPVGMLFTRELNGYVTKTPRGGAVIILDKGIVFTMGLVARCMLALTSWSSSKPYCRDHAPADFVAAIICLAYFEMTADYRYLNRIKVRDCPSIEAWDMKSVKVAALLEAFALLHEYGHIACGHLKSAKPGKGRQISRLRAREFEADEFAFKRLSSKLDPRAVGIAAVTFFRFLDLIEHLAHGCPRATDTHPAARARWQHLLKVSGIKDEHEEHVGRIESMFDMILRVEPDFINEPA
jgi:hypothetical protein